MVNDVCASEDGRLVACALGDCSAAVFTEKGMVRVKGDTTSLATLLTRVVVLFLYTLQLLVGRRDLGLHARGASWSSRCRCKMGIRQALQGTCFSSRSLSRSLYLSSQYICHHTKSNPRPVVGNHSWHVGLIGIIMGCIGVPLQLAVSATRTPGQP